MIVKPEHTRGFDTCTSCGARVGDQHTFSPLAVCWYVGRRFPTASRVLKNTEREPGHAERIERGG